jgi:hypothetical protein
MQASTAAGTPACVCMWITCVTAGRSALSMMTSGCVE